MARYEVLGIDMVNDETLADFYFSTRDEYDRGLSTFMRNSIDLKIVKFMVYDQNVGAYIFEVFSSTASIALGALMVCLNDITGSDNMVKSYTYNGF